MSWLVERAWAYQIGIPLSGNNKTYDSFTAYLLDLIRLAINLSSLLAILVIMVGAYKYVTSAGDEGKIKDAKDLMVGSVVGFVMLVFIRILVSLLWSAQ